MITDTYTALERSILHGLRLEWDSVMSFVSDNVRSRMTVPLFSLKHSGNSLAHWDTVKREIAFSRTFVLNHAWDAVKEVLVHEIAHQYTAEVLKASHESPHGPSFHKACRIFKANPEASGSYKPLSDRLSEQELSAPDRLMVKVKKLLALGTSMNRHEAEAAMAKAHALIRKYNIDLFERNTNTGFVSVYIGEPSLRFHREDYWLAHLLIEHYYVYGIWVPAYVTTKGKMGRVFEITGTVENVKIAAYVHGFIRHHMDSAWGVYNIGKNLGRARKTDFSSGLVQGFYERLTQEREALKAKGHVSVQDRKWSLVKIDPKLTEYIEYKYPRVRTSRHNGRMSDANVLNDGKDIGKNLILNKAVEKGHEGAVLSLPGSMN